MRLPRRGFRLSQWLETWVDMAGGSVHLFENGAEVVAMAGDLGGHGRGALPSWILNLALKSQWLETWVDMAGGRGVNEGFTARRRNGWRPGWTWQEGEPVRLGVVAPGRNGWRPGWTWQGKDWWRARVGNLDVAMAGDLGGHGRAGVSPPPPGPS